MAICSRLQRVILTFFGYLLSTANSHFNVFWLFAVDCKKTLPLFFSQCVMSFSRSLQSDAYAVWGLYCSHAAYCPFHMVEGLDVAMRGAVGRGVWLGKWEGEGFAML